MENTVYKRYENFLDGGDAVDFLVNIMELQKYRVLIKKYDNSLSLLAGIITFRHLDRSNQIKINKEIVSLIHSPDYCKLGQKLRDIITLSAVQPYWFTWSLSDQELRDYYELNNDFQNALSYIGFELPALTLAGVAGLLVNIRRKKVSKAAQEAFQESSGYQLGKDLSSVLGRDLSPRLLKTGGIAGASVFILCAVMSISTGNSANTAKKELILRSLLKMDEI